MAPNEDWEELWRQIKTGRSYGAKKDWKEFWRQIKTKGNYGAK